LALYRRHSIKILALSLVISIGVGEALIMLFLNQYGPFSPLVEVALDIALLTSLVVPIVILVVYKPMSRGLDQLIASENVIKKDEQIILTVAVERDVLVDELKLVSTKLSERENQMLALLNSLALAKDFETGGHVVRTQKYVTILALRRQGMGHFPDELEGARIETLTKVAPLHDIGKMGIPDVILAKAGKLTQEERKSIEAHTLIGESILSAAEFEEMADEDLISVAIKVAGGHHERWDGSGYPRGLIGNDIPVEARIMALADVYDALVSNRPYKRQWTHQQASTEIISMKNTHFDPRVVDAFLMEEANFLKVASEFA